MEQGIDHGAAIAGLILSGTGVHAHARRLIDYRDALIFVNYVQRNIFRKGLERRQLNRAGDDDFLTAAQLYGRLGRLSIDEDLFLLDQLLNADTADFGKLGDKPLIKTRSGGIRWNRKNLLSGRFCHVGIVVEGGRRVFLAV